MFSDSTNASVEKFLNAAQMKAWTVIFKQICPQRTVHNPPYVKAIELFSEAFFLCTDHALRAFERCLTQLLSLPSMHSSYSLHLCRQRLH